MRRTIKSRSGRVIVLATRQEDAKITAAAMLDADARPYSDEEWEQARPHMRKGRPPAAITKERITIRLSREVVQRFRATGSGWQSRIDAALQDWLKDHS